MANAHVAPLADDPVRRYLPSSYWDRQRDYFVYQLDVNTLAASATAAPSTFQVQNDSDFLVLEMSFVEATAAAGTTEQTFATFLMRISDSGSGAQWSDGFTHAYNWFDRAGGVVGNGRRVLEQPRFITGGSSVTVELTNLDAAVRRIWIAFHGVKIFRSMRRPV